MLDRSIAIPGSKFESKAVRKRTRTGRQVIDACIKENRANEWILYAFAIGFVVLGFAVIAWSLIHSQPVATLAGAIVTGLFAPAVYFIRQIRRENIKLRMLELPLSSAKSANEAADAIIRLFAEEFRDDKSKQELREKAVLQQRHLSIGS